MLRAKKRIAGGISDYQEIRDFNWPNIIDIALQTNEKDVVYDEDLIELVGELGIDMARVEKLIGTIRGAGVDGSGNNRRDWGLYLALARTSEGIYGCGQTS